MQMNAPFEVEASDLPDSICSRVVAIPSGKTEPMIFSVKAPSRVVGIADLVETLIKIESGKCIMNGTSIGEPCFEETNYLNITLNDVSKFNTLLVIGGGSCAATFAPKCLFKPVEPGNVIPQLSFPFARFQNGSNSVTINFSLIKSKSSYDKTLYKDGDVFCSWAGMRVDLKPTHQNCKNLTENKAEGRLDFTLEYQRVNSEEVTKFEFAAGTSAVGVTVYWNKYGESPDIVECKRFSALTTTSSGCSIGFTFSVLFGITQWIFN
nr:diagnostic antigen gp50 [Hymenolepis microstoma]